MRGETGMSDFAQAAVTGLAAAGALALLTWLASLVRHDVSLVDRVWSLLISTAGIGFAVMLPDGGARIGALLLLIAVWALRLAAYVSWRNWGHGEDRRYQAIRARNQPNFGFKSLYLIFALQAVLAWLVAMPVLAAAGHAEAWSTLDTLGAALAVFGITFEAVADAEMARFKADPAHHDQVMDQGLWRYSRHPNYFGECVIWWGVWLMALTPGGWWSIVSPLIMTVLLLKVSGVSLLEKDIGERRPAYRDYILRTNAFVPGPPRKETP
jgi:steroid 5-alpha reductase family enzyme